MCADHAWRAAEREVRPAGGEERRGRAQLADRGVVSDPDPSGGAALTHPAPWRGARSLFPRKCLAMYRHPHPPSAGALGPPSPAVRERSSAVVALQPLARIAGEGGERSEPGEGAALVRCRCDAVVTPLLPNGATSRVRPSYRLP